MSKNVPSALLTDIRRTVTTMATLVEIRRKDNQVLRLTSHDTDITFAGNVYRHDLPFSLSAISAGSSLGVDNNDMMLFADDVNLFREEFEKGLYEYADVTIFQVNYLNPANGRIIMRKGWFGATQILKTGFVKITVTGLLKILDFEVGRVFQPLCDADFGDSRCRAAVNLSQAHSDINPYQIGDWAYWYDTDLMTEIPVVNGSFEDDGVRIDINPITGWTKGPNASFIVANSGISIGNFNPLDGTWALMGGNAGTPLVGTEHFVYQDIDLAGAGIDVDDIDDGKIACALFVAILQAFYFLDPPRIRLEYFDEDGEVIDALDTGYLFLDTINTWRERCLATHLLPNTRSARIYIYFKQQEGDHVNCAADRVRFYWWDHTLGNPYDDAVHQCTRIVSFVEPTPRASGNGSFENATVANANNPTILGWTTGTGNWWQVVTSLTTGDGTLSAGKEGNNFLAGGDDGGASQKTYVTTAVINFSAIQGMETDRISLGKYAGRFRILVGWADISASRASVKLEFLDVSNVVVDTTIIVNDEDSASVGFVEFMVPFAVPVTARKMRYTLTAKSPVGDGAANVGFDGLEVNIFDTERWQKGLDPIFATGTVGTVFNTDPGSVTLDDQVVWRAHEGYVQSDTVASASSDKQFTGTDIAGAEGVYTAALIRWVSGANAGLKNLIRVWDPDTKNVKLYFHSPHPIQPGDRYVYVRSCQRRFTEDCRLTFNNQINFRGFPHIPGRLTVEDDAP